MELLLGKLGMDSVGIAAATLRVQDHPRLLKLMQYVRSNAADLKLMKSLQKH